MRRRRPQQLLLAALAALLADRIQAQSASASTASSVTADTTEADDCSACCVSSSSSSSVLAGGDPDLSLLCCQEQQPRNLFGTVHGECSGLPCCEYSGRKAQNHQAWYPCVAFPTCQNDTNKQAFCNGQDLWYYTEGYDWSCTDECCYGLVLDSNVWRGYENNYPGQTNGTFGVTITPTDFIDVFYPDGMDGETYTVHQIMLANPPGYNFTEGCSCYLERVANSTTNANRESTTCEVSAFLGGNRTYLTVDITENYQSNETFVFYFDGVMTPSGMNDSASTSNVTYTTMSNLTPVYFIFNDSENTAFDTYVRITELTSASLSSGSFLPENIYPGNSGNASLTFYTDANIPEGSSIKMTFGSKWGFSADAVWSWEVYPLVTTSEDDYFALAAATSTDTAGDSTNNFTSATYSSSDNSWTLIVEEAISIGWVSLGVNTVKNPSVAYSGLDATSIQIRDPEELLIIEGTFSAISVYLTSGATASPYNYVTMVVLVGSLAFCSVAIRKNGLSFSLGSIWTDITAICTVLALCTAIVNNFIWFFTRGSTYFYILHAYLCFTFTMLTAVCFHWGTVLSLRLRKLPKRTAVVAFVVLNMLFYAFQIGYLLNYQTLIARVYDSENDVTTLAYQQCNENADTSATVFSEIQGYLWACYAQDDDHFFLVSTSVTYGIFLVLTFVVMALGVMVMRRGKLLLGNASGPHQVVLVKALRLYYALIGIVTLVYLLSWVVQIISRTTRGIAYPWFYIFTVWLPCSIPPCCLIFLQWNATAQSLRDANRDMASDCSPLSESGYGEIRTPSFTFSTSDRWTEGSLEKIEEIMAEGAATADAVSSRRSLMNSTISPSDDYVGLSMALEMNEDFAHGCFIAIQRLEVEEGRDSSSAWRQISNTDTVMASVKDLAPVALPHQQRYLYTFLSVPRIPVSTSAEKIRMVVYALNSAPASVNHEDHSEMTAAEVLAAMERTQSSRDFDDDDGDYSQHTLDSSLVEMEAFGGYQSSQVIDELFEMESPGSTEDFTATGESRSESNSGSSIVPHTYRVVAEFTVSTGTLVAAGARTEQTVLTATEDSFKHFGPSAAPPKLLVNTVIPKAAGAKYGFNGVEGGLHAATPAISKQYHIREQGLLVVEDLTESRFSNWIPRQILEVIIRHRTKELLIAETDLARLEAYDRQRQKGSDRGIYENLIQQIQDDGDLNRCREWMLQRCNERKEYVELLRQLRRVYVLRDKRKMFFKASTEKKNSQLRFLPINLHLQEMWVGNADAVAQTSIGSSGTTDINASAAVYDIVTVGAMAAHVYKFKNGGIFGLEEQHAKLKPRVREPQGSAAAHHQVPLWTEDEQKADDVEWVLGKRMDVCFPQAVAALVTAFTRKVDLALQHARPEQGKAMLEQLSKLGFLFDVESLVSTHGNEAGMLEDMAGAVNELRNVRFVLVDEQEEIGETDEEGCGGKSPRSVSYRVDDETKLIPSSAEPSEASVSSRGAASSDGDEKGMELKVKQRQSMHLESLESAASSNSTNSTNSTGIGGVIDVDVFTSIDDALSETSSAHAGDSESSDGPSSSREDLMASQSSSFSGVGQRLLSTFIKARNHRLLGGPGSNWDNVQSLAPSSVDKLFSYTNLVIRVKLRSGKVKLTRALRHGGPIKVCPVLFTQGINEKQTLANNTGSSVTRLQDVINATSLKTLRNYCERYCNYTSMRQMQALQKHERRRDNSTDSEPGAPPSTVVPPTGPSRDEVYRILGELDKLIGTAGRQARKKRPEILQLSSDLCRSISGGRVTVCKSAKDRTGMSVTLEQGRILVQHHGLREQKKAGIVSVMRSEGVRIENALKNTGRRVFAFNALQRSLLPEEYRCPPQTSGRNVS